MGWSFAIIFILFVLLNIVLGVISSRQKRRYSEAEAQERGQSPETSLPQQSGESSDRFRRAAEEETPRGETIARETAGTRPAFSTSFLEEQTAASLLTPHSRTLGQGQDAPLRNGGAPWVNGGAVSAGGGPGPAAGGSGSTTDGQVSTAGESGSTTGGQAYTAGAPGSTTGGPRRNAPHRRVYGPARLVNLESAALPERAVRPDEDRSGLGSGRGRSVQRKGPGSLDEARSETREAGEGLKSEFMSSPHLVGNVWDRINQLSTLKRAVVLSEVMGKPKGLQDEINGAGW